MDPQTALRNALNDALTKTRIKNPAYSLRAFARRLGVGPAALSEILNGKRRVSVKLASRLVDRLNPGPAESSKLLRTFEIARATRQNPNQGKNLSQTATDPVGTAPAAYSQLTVDQFNVVADWYHFAILSLAETEDFMDTVPWIAKRLGIRKSDAQRALKRLERLGLMKRDSKGRLTVSGQQFSSPDHVANRAIRRSHAQHLDLATRSLEVHGVDERDFTGITMAIDPAKLPEAKRRIREFRDSLCAFLEAGEKSEVYRMNVQLLPLTQKATDEEETP